LIKKSGQSLPPCQEFTSSPRSTAIPPPPLLLLSASYAQSLTRAKVIELTTAADEGFKRLRDSIQGLIRIVKDYPYYKYNGIWSRDIQNVTFLVLFQGWLQRSYAPGNAENSLLTIEEVGGVLGIPVNLKTEDKFHLTIEEYLHAVLSLVEELVPFFLCFSPFSPEWRAVANMGMKTRLTTNAVTQHDFLRPQMINRFIKDIHSSFQVLNLKNDSLRRRGDGLKYNVSFLQGRRLG